MKIGIFDSGIGGLSVLHSAMNELPNVEFIYYADRDNVPYGEKTTEQILTYCKKNLDFLVEQDVDAIVIACNTATSVADQTFRAKYSVPIIGMEPAVKVALEQVDADKRVLVIATPVTIKGKKLRALVEAYDRNGQCDFVELPKLVRYAEQGVFDGEEIEEYLSEQLQHLPLRKEEYVVLGCTHFNYFKPAIQKLLPWVHFIDGNTGTIRQLLRKIPYQKASLPNVKRSVSFYYSGEKATEAELVQIKRYLRRLDDMAEIQ